MKSESEKCQGDPVSMVPPLYCEVYLQELNQIPIVSTREKFSHALAGRGGKGIIWKYVQLTRPAFKAVELTRA